MPELPDITVYIDALRPRVVDRVLTAARVKSPFLVRSVEPAIDSLEGRRVIGIDRLGKRIVFKFEDEMFLVLHLMIAGRLLWKPSGSRPTGKIDLATLEFGDADVSQEPLCGGTLVITEAGTKKRASLFAVAGRAGLLTHDPGGVEPLTCTLESFMAALKQENRTLKRALTSPHLFSGIGNAYSDEILHAARLSPVKLTRSLDDRAIATLHEATKQILIHWTSVLRSQFGIVVPAPTGQRGGITTQMKIGRFPRAGEITAFRPDFAVHGKYGQPCPVCVTKVHRIVRAENEINYCATCQTGGKLLADRSLSRLLKDDWPDTVEEWEAVRSTPT
ncbi:MAG: formamidopyrimidine-DNA glycosylase [Pyrinomonadaceae bacterium]|nr:formamidopyrimidine-DNA glycosylase [Phycisphaerales bacterium]